LHRAFPRGRIFSRIAATKQAGSNRDSTFTDCGFEQILKFLGGTVLPAAKDVPVNLFYDTRIIEYLKN